MKENGEPWYSYSSYNQQRFGRPLYRIPVSLNFSCPNRDENGRGGCRFCGESGALAVFVDQADALQKQVRDGVAYVNRRYGSDGILMAYFQAYTSTNAPIEVIREQMETVLAEADFKVVTVSTRPDCLPEPVLAYLAELAQRYELWVELGIQTIHNATLDYLNRGHHWEIVPEVVQQLDVRGIKVAAHVILGLPGESREMMMATAECLKTLPFSGLKIHNLHVVRGTELAIDFKKDGFAVWDEHEFADVLMEFLTHIPSDWPVLRLISDTPDELLIAPRWWMGKAAFLQYFRERMLRAGVEQGKPLQKSDFEVKKVACRDGSCTAFSPSFKSYYHSLQGADAGLETLFIAPLTDYLKKQKRCRILHVGFGTGRLMWLLAKRFPAVQFEVIGLEVDRMALQVGQQLFAEQTAWLGQLLATGEAVSNNLSVVWQPGDARQSIKRVDNDAFDVIIHNPFILEKNPELWSLGFFREMARAVSAEGIIVSGPAHKEAWAAAQKCGFEVKDFAAIPFAKEMMLLTKSGAEVSRRGADLPLKDPSGHWTRKRILRFHQRLSERVRLVDGSGTE